MYREIMRSRDLTPESKAIYAYLCSFAGCNTSCYPGVDMMRSELQMGADRFYKHMHLLTKKGIVTKTQERDGNRWGRTIYTLNHTPDFQLSQNEDTENQLSQNEDTQKQNTQNPTTNNNSLNNNSLNNNNQKTYKVNDMIDRVCELLNEGKAKAGGNKGRLKPSRNACYAIDELNNAGISNVDIVEFAKEISETGQGVDWPEFTKMLKKRKAEGKI